MRVKSCIDFQAWLPMPFLYRCERLFGPTSLLSLAGDGVLERILLPIVKYSLAIKRQKPRREERPRMSDNTLSPA